MKKKRVPNYKNIAIAILIIIFIALILFYNELGKKAYKSCVEKGHTETYCLNNI